MDYEIWNSRLLNHFFGILDSSTIEELDVSRREIEVAGQTKNGVASLMSAVRAKLRGADEKKLLKDWGFIAQIGSEPKYIAFLIATCRVEWERESGTFASALGDTLGVSPNAWIDLIPSLWNGLNKYLAKQRVNNLEHRIIELPTSYESFSKIGYSVGLVFPYRTDRRRLEEMFSSYTSTDPPINQVVEDLLKIRSSLSKDCQAEVTHYCANAFSKADKRVRRFSNTLSRSLRNALYQIDDDAVLEDAVFDFAIWIDEDGLAEPWLLQLDDSETPEGFRVAVDLNGLPGWSRVIEGTNENPSAINLFQQLEDPDPAYVQLSTFVQAGLELGLLPLSKVEDGVGGTCYSPSASEIEDIVAYLVLDSRKQEFESNSASLQEIRIDNSEWSIVFGETGNGAKLESRLSTATPRITVSGQTYVRGFITTSFSEPIVKCSSATFIKAVRGSRSIKLVGDNINGFIGLKEFEGEVQLTAYDEGNDVICNRKVVILNKLAAVVPPKLAQPDKAFWLPSGKFSEGARPSGSSLTWFGETGGGIDEPPSIEAWLDDDVWLGPRVGDVSSARKEGFEWRLSESSNGEERLLYFDGDITNPTLPIAEEKNSNKSACRLWRRAFDRKSTTLLRPAWQDLFDRFSILCDPNKHKALLAGKPPTNFKGVAPPARRHRIEKAQSNGVSEKVGELERLLLARASSIKAPLRWNFIFENFTAAFEMEVESTLDLIRAWQEIGVFDIAGMPWRGTVVIPRKPRFLTWRTGKDLVARLVGLNCPEIRQAVKDQTPSDWLSTVNSVCKFAPCLLQLKTSDVEMGRDHISLLAKNLNLDAEECLPWRETQELPPCLNDLNEIEPYFAFTPAELPVTPPFSAKQFGEARVEKVKPHGFAPQWIVSKNGKDLSAICSSYSWAHRLASLAIEATIPFRFSDGKFARCGNKGAGHAYGQYLPLQAARLLTVLSNTLPGPVGNDYQYFCPTDLTGKVIADRLAIGKRN